MKGRNEKWTKEHIMIKEKLSDLVDSYLRDSGIAATAFGMRIAADPNLVFDLRRGRSPRPALYSKILGEININIK
jgi:hypothetical protein